MKGVIALIMLLPFVGCATLINGNRQNVSFNSVPIGATVKTGSGDTCLTPCIMNLRRSMSETVLIEKEGYEVSTAILTKKFSPWILLNLWFFPGFIVDLATKDYYDLDPDTVYTAMVKKVEPVAVK